MYSTSLPPSLKSFTLLNAQARSNTLLQNQRASAYSANSIQMQQPLQHGDKLQFSGKRLEELKQKRALEAAEQKKREKMQEEAEAKQKMLDAFVQIQMNNFIFGKLEANSSDKEDDGPVPDLKKLEQEAYTALKNNPNYPTNLLIDDVMEDDGDGRTIKWTLLHKAISHGVSSIVDLLLTERNADVLIRDSDGISPLDTARAMANNSDGFYSEEQAEVHQHIYDRVKAVHDKQQAEIDKIDKAHKGELKARKDAEASQSVKKKAPKLSRAARKLLEDEQDRKQAAEKKRLQALNDRYNALDVPEPAPEQEDTEGIWETQKKEKAKSKPTSPEEERKSQASSPVSTRGDNHHRRTSTNSSREMPKGNRKQEKSSSATSSVATSPTMTKASPASERPAQLPSNPWKKAWLEPDKNLEPPIEETMDSPKVPLGRATTEPSELPSTLQSQPEEPPIRPLETMRDLSRTLPTLRTSGLASPSSFSFTTSSSASSLADRARIKQLKGQRDEQRLLLEQGSENARQMQSALNWKDWHFNNLLNDFNRMRQNFLALQQQMMAPPPAPMFQQPQTFVPLNEQQRSQNLEEQEHVMQNMEHMQGLIRQLRDTAEPQALEKMKKDSEQALVFEPDPSGTGYVIAKGPRKGEWFKEIPTEPPRPFKDQGKQFD